MEYQIVPANDLKPGDVLVNQGKIKSVKLTTKEVIIVMYGTLPAVLGSLQETEIKWPSCTTLSETVLAYKEKMTIVKRADDMVDLAVHEFGRIALTEAEFAMLPKKENPLEEGHQEEN